MKLTAEQAQQLARDDEHIEWVVHPAMVEALVVWLDEHGVDLVQGPPQEYGDGSTRLKWFVASPRSLQAPA